MRAVLLTLTVCLCVLPANAKYSGGAGEPNDAYQIATAADLIALGETPADYDKHFILTADIDLDPNLPGGKVFDKAVIAPDTNDANWSFDGTSFRGVFDGNGHTILHLTIIGGNYLGLFGQLGGLWASPSDVRNLRVLDVSVTGTGTDIGGLVGYNAGGTLARCYSSGAIGGGSSVGGLVGDNRGTVLGCYSAGAVSGASSVGGLVGYNGTTVAQCCSTGAVSGTSSVGGLVGYSGGSVIECYSSAAVSGTKSVGGLVGCNGQQYGSVTAHVTSCYSTGTVTGSGQYIGALVGWSGNGFVSASFWDTQTSGQATSGGGVGKSTAQMRDPKTFTAAGWDFVGQPDGPHDIWAEPEGGGYPLLWWQIPAGFGLPGFSGGTGAPDDPYLISRPEELNRIGNNPRLMKCRFKLIENVDLTGFHFYPIGGHAFHAYAGVFDGNDHTISHLTITGDGGLGLFSRLASGAEVKNLGVVEVNIVGSGGAVGALVGDNREGSVTNCFSTGAVSGTESVGGLVGRNYRTRAVTRCHSGAVVVGTGDRVGGLVGANDWGGNLTQCYSTGAVSGRDCVAGLVGWNVEGTVTQCYSTGAVSGNSQIGGLVGNNAGTVSECHNGGTVSGAGSYIGGLVGYNAGTIRNSHVAASVAGNSSVGGLAGTNGGGGTISTCYSVSFVTGGAFVGGLLGTNASGAVAGCFWDIETSGQATSAGGAGMTTAEMQAAGTFLGWGFEPAVWTIDEGKDYPRLWWENGPGQPIARIYHYGGGSGTPADPYLVHTPEQLNMIGLMICDWDRHFKLMADIDLSAFDGKDGRPAFNTIGECYLVWNMDWPALVGTCFSGVFDGGGHTISHLTVKSQSGCGGFFSGLGAGGQVKNVGVVDVNMTSPAYDPIGALVGFNTGTVSRCYSTGVVSGGSYVGGLVGCNVVGTVTQCYSTGVVSGGSYVGGLVGYNVEGTVTQCCSATMVAGTPSGTGGLVGANEGAVVTGCYSTGAVSGKSMVGGLVGDNSGSTVIQCYSTGAVSGSDWIGGLVGSNSGAVTHCYSIGTVGGTGQNVGGLVGQGPQSYVTRSFWDTQTSRQTASAGGTGKTTTQMQTASTFLDAGWDFVGETANGTEDIWWIDEGKDYPRLWWEAPAIDN